MKIKIFKLLKMIKYVYGAIKNKKINILSTLILIKNIKEKTFCIGINEEIEIIAYDINESFNENINVLIKYDVIYNICKSHDENSSIQINLLNNNINILINESFYSIPHLYNEIFPSFKHEKNFKIKIKIKSLQILELLKINALTLHENNYFSFLNGSLIEINRNIMHIVSSDGIRISFSYILLKEQYEKIKIIIPKNTVLELLNNFKNDEHINILISENQIKFINKYITLTSRLIDDIYILPNINFSKTNKQNLKLNTKIFKKSLDKIYFFALNNKINISLKNNLLNLHVKNNNEIAQTNFICNENHEINFNIDYKLLIDIIKLMKNENFELIIPYNNNFLIIKEYNSSYMYIIPQLK